MLAIKRMDNPEELREFLDGTRTAQGTAAVATAGSTTVTTTGNAFADVSVGDGIYFSGNLQRFTVVTKSDDNTLVLDSAPSPSGSMSATHWRSFSAPGVVSMDYVVRIDYDTRTNKSMVIYHAATFVATAS